MIRAALIVLAVTAGAAQALTSAAPCLWDLGNQRQVMPDAFAAAMADGSGEYGKIVDIHPIAWTDTFVDFEWRDSGRTWLVLHHCPTDKYLMWSADDAEAALLRAQYTRMIESDLEYTLAQMGKALRKQGAVVALGQGDIGRCDCKTLGFTN